MKAIMYHYAMPEDPEFPYFNNLHIEDFERQLNYFKNKYGFVTKEDFLTSLQTGKPSQGVILTFDDGLKCHYKYVLPILLKYNLWGIFYIPTGIYHTGKILDVHRIHVLLGKIDPEIVLKTLLNLVQDHFLVDSRKAGFFDLTYLNQSNNDSTNSVKRILNYFISYSYRERIIDQLSEELLPKKYEVEDYYMTTQELTSLADAGMIIGSHTVNHPVLSKLNLSNQKTEITESFQFLENSGLIREMKTFCYPYGGFHTFTSETEDILSQENCDFSFNVESRDISKADLTTRKQALPRYDCNELKHGQVRKKI